MTGTEHRPRGGDADYDRIGPGYARHRRPDPEIAALVDRALGSAPTVLNVGAGAGSYEPRDRRVIAVEPSASMRAQRPVELAAAVDATAEALPFADDSVDAALASFTVHQWRDLDAGLAELRRVSTGPVVVLTCDPDRLGEFWLAEYAPELIATERRRYPTVPRLRATLSGPDARGRRRRCRVVPVAIPLHCDDGFNEAYYGRPERLLDPAARRANSAWSFVDEAAAARAVDRLAHDLEDGTWDRRHGHLRALPHYAGSLVLLVSTLEDREHA